MNPIWRVPWARPTGLSEPDMPIFVDSIIFQLQHDGNCIPVSDWENHQYRYRCMSCYLSWGSDKDTFSTQYERAKYLKDGPTIQQQDEMSDHARQHSIMWAWAKGLK